MSDRVLVIGMAAVVALVIIVFVIALGVEEKPKEIIVKHYDEPVGTSNTSNENNNQKPDETLIEENHIEMASSYVRKLIADNDLTTLFGLLNFEYRRMLFDDEEEKLAEFMEKEYPSGDIKVENTKVSVGNLYVYAKNKNSEQKVITIMNYRNEDSKYDVHFGEYLGSSNLVGIYQDSKVLINITNQIEYYDDTSIIMRITNLTDTKQKIDFSGSYLKTIPNIKNNKTYTNKSDKVCEVDAKSSCIYELSFDKMTRSIHYIGLKFRINDSDQVYSKEISINEDFY